MPRKHYFILSIIGLFWIGGAVGLYFSDPQRDLKIIFAASTTFGVIIATYINLVLAASRDDFQRMDNAFLYAERWDSPVLKEARDFTRSLKKRRSRLSDDALIKEIASKKELERSIITVFNFWQEVYHAISYKRVRPELLHKMLAHVYIDMFDRFKPWLSSVFSTGDMDDFNALYKMWRQ